jgi:hypothetical protein
LSLQAAVAALVVALDQITTVAVALVVVAV